ncbi:hypothetical protein BaRGS_00035776 [Batillaria attramentaria]|uniref:Uncharacterized protein n=1 Tax=Batillaria attramentaria TaxID=370345 RepID=A0ABD0JF43_9CAEN
MHVCRKTVTRADSFLNKSLGTTAEEVVQWKTGRGRQNQPKQWGHLPALTRRPPGRQVWGEKIACDVRHKLLQDAMFACPQAAELSRADCKCFLLAFSVQFKKKLYVA